MSAIYFIGSRDDPQSLVKIGYTRGDVNDRLKALQTGSPVLLEVLLSIPGTMRDEQDLHVRFRRHRVHGEWFRFGPEIAEFVLEVEGEPLRRDLVRAANDPDRLARLSAGLSAPPEVIRDRLLCIAAGGVP